MGNATQIIQELRDGDPRAADRLLAVVYDELRRLAARKLSRERPGQTLQATALVHEAYLRLLGDGSAEWENKIHFFAAAAEAMRRILIESARRKARIKHGGEFRRHPIDESAVVSMSDPTEMLALDEALGKLEAEDKIKADLVKLRYFAGLSVEQAGEILGISRATVDRYWTFARTWLFNQMTKGEDS